MSNDDPHTLGFLHPGDEIQRFGNCVLIKCRHEDNAVILLEIFRDIANGKTVTIGRGDTDNADA